jgi:hypothetical protein
MCTFTPYARLVTKANSTFLFSIYSQAKNYFKLLGELSPGRAHT